MSELEDLRNVLQYARHPHIITLLKQHEQSLLASESKHAKHVSNHDHEHHHEHSEGCSHSHEHKESASSTHSSHDRHSHSHNHDHDHNEHKRDHTTMSQDSKGIKLAPSPPVRVFGNYTPINDYIWDQGSTTCPTVTIYIDLENVGSVKDNVTCDFTKYSFDLRIHGLHGKDYRLVQENLDRDIDPATSKFIVKPNKVILKLAKVKGEYGFQNWNSLASKKTKEQRIADENRSKDKDDIVNDTLKDMYETGDEETKRIIGEAMLRSRNKQAGGTAAQADSK